jgi:hypothetical protein
MNRNDLENELSRLREASERIAANLVELEIDSSRQLLESSTLTGASAARWAAASAALTNLWSWRALLDDLLERAEKLYAGRRHADELSSLLTGPSIELTSSPVPLAERDLLGSAENTTRCTPDELIARMSSAFDEVKTALTEFGATWSTLDAGLADARSRLAYLTTVIQEARAAHEQVVAKIALSTPPPSPELPDDPRLELGEIEQLARSGDCLDAQRRLGRWTSRTAARLDEAQRILRVNRAPLEARGQLRGLLEAYRVKAARMHAIEDPELERIYAEARDALYTAPTDLAQVAQLVRRYQEILGAAPPTREALR